MTNVRNEPTWIFPEGYFWQLLNCRGFIRKYDDSETRTNMDISEGYFYLFLKLPMINKEI
jgi:hypothetical protein